MIPASFIYPTNAALPSGALGIWYADRAIDNAGNFTIPNSVSTNPVPKNLFRTSRRHFNNTDWQPVNLTVVDDVVVGPDGKTEASTLSAVINWLMRPLPKFAGFGGTNLPAGTYTIAVNAKRNAGSDQQFKLYAIGGTPANVIETATSVWQRFALTFTWPGGPIDCGVCSFDGITGVDLAICDLELFSGGADLGPELLTGAINLGYYADYRPTVSGKYLDFTATNSYGYIQLPDPAPLGAFTLSILLNRTVAPAGSTQGVLTDAIDPTQLFFADNFNPLQASTPGGFFGGTTFGPQAYNGMWDQFGAGPHVLTAQYDGLRFRIFFDDTIVFFNPANAPSTVPGFTAISEVFYLCYTVALGTSYAAGEFGAMALYDRALTPTELYKLIDVWKSRFSFALHAEYLICDGDSLTQGAPMVPSGTFQQGWPYYLGPLMSNVIGFNFAEGGQTIEGRITRSLPLLLECIPPASRQAGRKWWFGTLVGTNDFGVDTGADAATLLGTSYVDILAAAGYSVYTATLTDRNDGSLAAWTIYGTAFNDVVFPSGMPWAHGTAVVDLAGNINLGPIGSATAPNNTTYYSGDKLHLELAGQQLVASLFNAAGIT